MKNKTIFIILFAFLGIGALVYFFWDKIKAIGTKTVTALKNTVQNVASTVPEKGVKFLSAFVIRDIDVFGSGHYGASRDGGARSHKALDLVIKPFDPFKLPVKTKIIRTGQVYDGDTRFRLVELEIIEGVNKGLVCKCLYINSKAKPNQVFEADTKIGYYQDVGEKHSGITPHWHIKVTKNGVVIDPTQFV